MSNQTVIIEHSRSYSRELQPFTYQVKNIDEYRMLRDEKRRHDLCLLGFTILIIMIAALIICLKYEGK